MLRCMHRTNIYLTEEQDRVLRARAAADGTTKSAVIREILDRDLGPSNDDDLRADFAELADNYPAMIEGLFDGDPDLRIER